MLIFHFHPEDRGVFALQGDGLASLSRDEWSSVVMCV